MCFEIFDNKIVRYFCYVAVLSFNLKSRSNNHIPQKCIQTSTKKSHIIGQMMLLKTVCDRQNVYVPVNANAFMSDKKNNNKLIHFCLAVNLLYFPQHDDKHLQCTVRERD